MTEHQHSSDGDQKHRDHLVEGLRFQAGRPSSADPSPWKAPGQQVKPDGPMGCDQTEGHRPRPEGQGGGDHDEARGLVQDHRLERREAEHSDEQRQAELGSAKADQAAKGANDGATAEGHREITWR